MPRVVHFEFAAENPERAEKFFSGVFGWAFQKWSGEGMEYWLVNTGHSLDVGIDGGMVRKGTPPTAFTIQVASLDRALEKIKKEGGSVTMPRAAIPGVGWFAKFQDTEGNEFGLMEPDMKAK